MACTSTTLLSLSLILFFNLAGSQLLRSDLESDSPDCTGRWVHIRKLPSKFNLDLLTNCSHYPLYDNFCPHLANHGLGPKTHTRSHSWYRTVPFMLELYFHRRILEYPCLTSNPSAADAIYLPYYAGIDALRYLYGPDINSSPEHGLELFEFLQQDSPHIWGRNAGHDHFLVMARPAWDFSQPLTNVLKACEIVNCSNAVCELDPIRYMKPMLQSSFCLQPPGDSPTRRSTFDGILAGCIPVFFEERSAKSQFGWHLPKREYGEFSVSISKEEVVLKGLRIVDVLMAIPRADVRRMRDRVIELMPRIIYRRHGSSLGLSCDLINYSAAYGNGSN
ncbi:hypothetical protein HHK36_000371 [Tetracentron sinense]|uniref:Exostosin GT47 domain-containing protein n=1 Tax=Tetracentron sinense TaxID=13715 RepID=A0A834ZTZ7_TETSI|nr:hypothetical protein HHK36_000371 [Tetracentron sinense]